MKLLIATKNRGKFSEIVEVLGTLPITMLSLSDAGIEEDIEETGVTHEENALLKARYFFERSGGVPTLGEDSGIYVDAFPDELGVATRRWNGLGTASDAEWIEYFLKKMENVPEAHRTARFVCCSALILPNGDEHIFVGETRGLITHTLEAPLIHGIPLSSCFRPDGLQKVYASLTPQEKNAVSHRGKAMHQLKDFLMGHIKIGV